MLCVCLIVVWCVCDELLIVCFDCCCVGVFVGDLGLCDLYIVVVSYLVIV